VKIKVLWQNILANDKILAIFLVLLATIASVVDYNLSEPISATNNQTYYNNYLIFKQSFFNLLSGKDLYIHHPLFHFDLFKYSSTFALFFGFFSYLPDVVGMALWNSLNLLMLYFAVKSIPNISSKYVYAIIGYSFFEMMTSVQNEQSNTLMLALVIFTFSKLEKRQYIWAAFCLGLSFYTKLFGLVGFSLFLFYPQKFKFSLATMFWMIVLFVLPLIVISWDQLVFNYESWLRLLGDDHSGKVGISVMGILTTWLGVTFNQLYVLFSGVILFCVPLLRISQYQFYRFRVLMLSSVLIWVVIFNHMAESPTFIIAAVGVIIWYLNSKRTKLDLTLLIFVFVLTTLSATDLFPSSIRNTYVKPYALKALPVILVWVKLMIDLLTDKFNQKLRIG
jgi:hypothetical protein